MNILMITDCFPPPLEGGSTVYLHNLASNFPDGQVHVLTNKSDGYELFDREQSYKVHRTEILFHDYSKLDQGRMLLSWQKKVRGLLKNNQIDIVNAGNFFLAGLTARWIKKKYGIPYILNSYAEELNQLLHRKDRIWGPFKRRMCQKVVKDADGFVVVSDYTGKLLQRFGASPEDIIKIVPMIIERPRGSENNADKLRNELGIKQAQNVLLTVGRLKERKGQDQLIRAMPRLLPKYPQTTLIIVGRGPYEEKLKFLIKDNKLEESVIMAGFVPDEELSEYYNLCDVFIMPHRELDNGDTEGCPTVFLEAASYGKPSIGGNAGGVSDAIIDGKTGIIVDGTSVDSIVEALIFLLSGSKLAREYGENGRIRVREELSPMKGAEILHQLCRDVIAKRQWER